jgi:hypothetical protein
MNDEREPAANPWKRRFTFLFLIAVALPLLVGLILLKRFGGDVPVDYASPTEHFKYGSTGGEHEMGFPYWIWRALPEVCPQYLPGKGYQSLGMVYEKNAGRQRARRAGRHLETPLPGHRPRVRQLRRLPRQHRAHRRRPAADHRPRHAGRHLQHEGLRGILLPLRRRSEILQGIHPSRNRAPGRRPRPARPLPGLPDRHRHHARPRAGAGRALRLGVQAARMGAGPGRHLQFGQGHLQLPDGPPRPEGIRRARPTSRRSGASASARSRRRCNCTGTATTPPSRSATRAPPSAPARRRRPSTSSASSASRTGYSMPRRPNLDFFPSTVARRQGAPLYKEYCAACHGASGSDFSGDSTSAPSSRWPKSAPTAAASIPTPTRWRSTRPRSTPATRGASPISRRPTATPTCRSTASGCARPTCTTARCPACATCSNPPPTAHRPSTAATTSTTRSRSASSPTSPEANGKKFFRLDTSVPGNGNGGHEGKAYGTELSAGEKAALVEYLKTF